MQSRLQQIFVRNDKFLHSLEKKFVATTTRQEKIKRDKLFECECKIYL